MSSAKTEVFAIINKMSDDLTAVEIASELYFKAKVDNGLKQLDEGKGISFEEAKGRFKWLN